MRRRFLVYLTYVTQVKFGCAKTLKESKITGMGGLWSLCSHTIFIGSLKSYRNEKLERNLLQTPGRETDLHLLLGGFIDE